MQIYVSALYCSPTGFPGFDIHFTCSFCCCTNLPFLFGKCSRLQVHSICYESLTFPSLSTRPAVSNSAGNACCCLPPVSSDTPSSQLSASNYIPWLHELSAPSLHGLRLFSSGLWWTKLKPDTVPTVPHAPLSGCPHTTPVSTAMSPLPNSSPSSALDDEFSARLEQQLRPLGTKLTDIQVEMHNSKIL